MYHFSAISPRALELLKTIVEIPDVSDFYLVGGTALALNCGHRLSIDLDFFTSKEFDTNFLKASLSESFSITVLSQAKNSLTVEIDSVKTDFIRHNYPLIKPLVSDEGIRMASVEDIAAMKLNSTMNRGAKKDFFDIDELLNLFSIEQLLSFHSKKYAFSEQLILLKSLVFFDDAENEPDPVSLRTISWDSVKQKISNEVTSFIGL